jgi:hypothetical protein
VFLIHTQNHPRHIVEPSNYTLPPAALYLFSFNSCLHKGILKAFLKDLQHNSADASVHYCHVLSGKYCTYCSNKQHISTNTHMQVILQPTSPLSSSSSFYPYFTGLVFHTLGEIFRTCPDRSWGPPCLLYNWYRFFSGVKSGRGVALTPHPLLLPWS